MDDCDDIADINEHTKPKFNLFLSLCLSVSPSLSHITKKRPRNFPRSQSMNRRRYRHCDRFPIDTCMYTVRVFLSANTHESAFARYLVNARYRRSRAELIRRRETDVIFLRNIKREKVFHSASSDATAALLPPGRYISWVERRYKREKERKRELHGEELWLWVHPYNRIIFPPADRRVFLSYFLSSWDFFS